MFSLLGSLLSGGASLLGGLFGQRNQDKINQENIANQDFLAANRISMTVEDAKRAGINPLAALGNATQSYSNVVGSDSLASGIAGAGQSIGRAVGALADGQSRRDELENKLLEAKIANVNADTVHQMAVASGMARGSGSVGTPPAPLPQPNPLRTNWDAYYAKPLMEKYVGPHGGVVDLPTGAASTAMQNWASMPAQIAVATGLTGENLENARADLFPGGLGIRGDVWRGVDNSQYVPF